MKGEAPSYILLSFCPARLQAAMAIVGLLGAFFVARLWLFTSVFGAVAGRRAGNWAADLAWLVPLAIVGAILWRLIRLSRGDRAALRATAAGLEVKGFFQQRAIDWRDVIGAHEVVYGFGLYTRRLLNIRYLQDGSNRTVRVPLVLTQRPKGGSRALIEAVDAAQARALGRTPDAAGLNRPIGDGAIDPDAAIARYLAHKQAEAAKVPVAQGGVSAVPRAPSRPAFGRKGVSS